MFPARMVATRLSRRGFRTALAASRKRPVSDDHAVERVHVAEFVVQGDHLADQAGGIGILCLRGGRRWRAAIWVPGFFGLASTSGTERARVLMVPANPLVEASVVSAKVAIFCTASCMDLYRSICPARASRLAIGLLARGGRWRCRWLCSGHRSAIAGRRSARVRRDLKAGVIGLAGGVGCLSFVTGAAFIGGADDVGFLLGGLKGEAQGLRGKILGVVLVDDVAGLAREPALWLVESRYQLMASFR